jgi:hypothetical protein
MLIVRCRHARGAFMLRYGADAKRGANLLMVFSMLGQRLLAGVLLAALSASPLAAADNTVSVMVLGVYHMSNPGKDYHNVKTDDVLAPKRQAEIAAAVDGLAAFHPTQVDVEWPADIVEQRYPAYQKGTLAPSQNEVVQLGFRLAQKSGASVQGVDVDGDFPYEAVQAYAKAHGQADLLAAADAEIARQVQEEQDRMKTGTVSQILRSMNDAESARRGHAFYRSMLHIGGGAEQPGAELLTAWEKRNNLICANIVQRAKPGDRIVVIFGAGHEYLLRQCFSEMPGYTLVDPNGYLPK